MGTARHVPHTASLGHFIRNSLGCLFYVFSLHHIILSQIILYNYPVCAFVRGLDLPVVHRYFLMLPIHFVLKLVNTNLRHYFVDKYSVFGALRAYSYVAVFFSDL
jgi:hypothetical protein